jgi:hypothetical protein
MNVFGMERKGVLNAATAMITEIEAQKKTRTHTS